MISHRRQCILSPKTRGTKGGVTVLRVMVDSSIFPWGKLTATRIPEIHFNIYRKYILTAVKSSISTLFDSVTKDKREHALKIYILV